MFSMNILTLKNISYSYHSLREETPALKDISFSVKEGEFLAIVGPSGCGKSTLLSIIAGLLAPENGSIIEMSANPAQEKLQIGYMLQKDHLLPYRNIFQNVMLGPEIQRINTPAIQSYAKELLEEYGLGDVINKYPDELSGGMRQRVALIRTMVLNPTLLLLDEPFSALDYQTRLYVSADICSRIRKANKTAVLITHDLSEAISLADRIIVLSGRPATVKREIPIHLSCKRDDPIVTRTAKEFNEYFEILWKELYNEKH